ncbi:MAG: hypothetical protein JWO81_2152 [Alphaproteobacteria bacterium]|nr:hypothetical protein [Alphaproteobacteria bacterium]
MSYIDRLNRTLRETPWSPELTKLTKPGSVSFVSERRVAIVEKYAGNLPAEILLGLKRLSSRPRPSFTRLSVWVEIVADAMRLLAEGHAEEALAYGWDPHHL